LINSFPGSVYATPDQSGAIFVVPESCHLLANVISEVINEPTTAGPTLDITVLRELLELIGEYKIPVNEDAPPVVLSQELAIYLQLIIEQIIIQSTLPVKLQFTCRDCGKVWLDDPDRIAQREAEQRNARRSQALFDITNVANAIEGHHKILAGIRGYAALTRGQPNSDIRCSYCRGNRLDRKYVTFCPNCHELRTEAILLECTNCAYNFRDLSSGQLWTTVAEALDQFKLSFKQVAISEAMHSLYRYALPNQVNDLVSGLSPSEQLLGISRCGVVGNRRRNTFILFTSEKIVWTSQGLLSSERHMVPWNQVQELSDPADGSGDARLTLADGSTVVFSAFIGQGIDMSASGLPSGSNQEQQGII